MKKTQCIELYASRVFAARVWCGEDSLLTGRRALYAKARELIAGDRAQAVCQQEIDKEQES